RLPENPTQVIVDQNVLIHTNLPLHDFDGDGCLDFAMYKTDITVTEIAKWVRQAFGQIEGNLNFFLFNRAANCYGTRPDRRVAPSSSKPITMRFKVDLMEAMMGLVWERYLSTMMRFEGDYNGDGRPDLLVREKTEQISIYFNTGRRDPLFSRDPDIVLDNLPNFGGLALSDLNADGCTDLLLYSGNYDQVIAVYISRKK
ncbi:MAG TPA: VCBS repeat-containing protein, partial [Planctomycetota bacterium]|nr:VCBS repeat-containing protein [Planctomycetota bacterium]